jgi:predicted nucleic acid-binding protein
MSQGLADTSLFIANEAGRPVREDRLPEAISVSVITIGELRAGVLAADTFAVRDTRLATLTNALALDPIPIDQSVAEAWATLRLALRDQGIRMLVNDSWIAATAISIGIPLVTQDDDYLHVPGLEVIHV